jgi:DNA modification methylase
MSDSKLKYFYKDPLTKVYRGDCLEVLPKIKKKFSSVICDPPYGLKFMGKEWDHGVPGVQFWDAVRMACLPGSMLLAFGGTRTYHRLACAIEDAGWEIRDCLMWVYGSGFPKSHNVSKAIDKKAGAEREVVGNHPRPASSPGEVMKTGLKSSTNITEPATEAAKLWDGYGTALKPAWEPILLAMNPIKNTFAENALKYGIAGLNIEGCRVGTEKRMAAFTSLAPCHSNKLGSPGTAEARRGTQGEAKEYTGRWPANLIHDGSDEVVELFPDSKDGVAVNRDRGDRKPSIVNYANHDNQNKGYGGEGSAARFFYCAKVSKKERGEGNTHPTVKPLKLLEYLCKLTAMPDGLILDPFCGSGSTLLAARALGLKSIGIDINREYCKIAKRRLGE